mmetsp:Transcript_19459/g.44318  ORF Transcript_19459/g.44318 Transcript_19459/m.44318 type:complete len:150 (-) Transcript_19459:17-466(-)
MDTRIEIRLGQQHLWSYTIHRIELQNFCHIHCFIFSHCFTQFSGHKCFRYSFCSSSSRITPLNISIIPPSIDSTPGDSIPDSISSLNSTGESSRFVPCTKSPFSISTTESKILLSGSMLNSSVLQSATLDLMIFICVLSSIFILLECMY